MKTKSIIAMFVTSIIAFVASLGISIGIASALADPTPAVGLQEINFKVSSKEVKYSAVFDPTSTFNGDVTKELNLSDWDNIVYQNAASVNQIKLIKITVTNDTELEQRFSVFLKPTKANEAASNASYKLFDLNNASGLAGANGIAALDFNRANGTTIETDMHLEKGKTAHFILAAYVSDTQVAKEIVLGGDNSIYANISIVVA